MASEERYTVEYSSYHSGWYIADNRPDYRTDQDAKMYCGESGIWSAYRPPPDLFKTVQEAQEFIEKLKLRGKEEGPG